METVLNASLLVEVNVCIQFLVVGGFIAVENWTCFLRLVRLISVVLVSLDT